MITYQDYQDAVSRGKGLAFIGESIAEHMSGADYKMAEAADEYDAQRNITINAAAHYIYSLSGKRTLDFTASNNRIASNFFHRLITQRATYSLGNGVTFDAEGVKEKLGPRFDTDLYNVARTALKHGVSFGFWNFDRLHLFPLTEFVPFADEEDGRLRAGIRFWCLDRKTKPVYAMLYEEDGFTKYVTRSGMTGLNFSVAEEKRPYTQTYVRTRAGGDELIGGGNYGALPIVPMYGNANKQSALVGMRAAIDCFDLIASGFCDNLIDTAEIYWIIGNALGMNDDDVQRFMDRLRLQHVAVVDTENSSVTPHTQDVPYAAREACLNRLASGIYRDFGAFNPEDVAAGRVTATQINAAYQPMDEEADAFEYQVIEFVQPILSLMGIDAVPQFKRNRIANQSEIITNLAQIADHIDEQTFLELNPMITPDMIPEIMARKDAEDARRWTEDDAGSVQSDGNGGFRYVE